MRTKRGEKELLREKILLRAIPSLKKLGGHSVPVDTIMKHVGLTSGALYSHFKSKEDFFAQIVLRDLDSMLAFHERNVGEGPDALIRYVEMYLVPAHVPAVDHGCLFAALGSDLHRFKPQAREKFEEKIQSLFVILARGVPEGHWEQRMATAQFVFSSLVGALTLARSQKTPEASQAILTTAKHHLLTLLRKGS